MCQRIIVHTYELFCSEGVDAALTRLSGILSNENYFVLCFPSPGASIGTERREWKPGSAFLLAYDKRPFALQAPFCEFIVAVCQGISAVKQSAAMVGRINEPCSVAVFDGMVFLIKNCPVFDLVKVKGDISLCSIPYCFSEGSAYVVIGRRSRVDMIADKPSLRASEKGMRGDTFSLRHIRKVQNVCHACGFEVIPYVKDVGVHIVHDDVLAPTLSVKGVRGGTGERLYDGIALC